MATPQDSDWFARLGIGSTPTTPAVRTLDKRTGEEQDGDMGGRGWTPRRGDVAAATYAKENGSYVE